MSMCEFIYCRSSNIRDVLIFTNFAKRTNSRIQESCENYYYIGATIVKMKIREFLTLSEISNSRKFKHAKITRSTVCVYLSMDVIMHNFLRVSHDFFI